MTATSIEISKQISKLDASVVGFEQDLAGLALSAVSGDAKTIKSVNDLTAKIARARADREVLEYARTAALDAEREQRDQKAADQAALHMSQAREQATRMLGIAERTDRLIADFRAALADLAEAERQIHKHLRLAGQADPGGVVGRQGIAAIARGRMTCALDNLDRFQNHGLKDVGERVRLAWGELIEAGGSVNG